MFDLTELGSCLKYRFYYEIKVKNEVAKTMSLNEGKKCGSSPINEIRTLPNVTPYDRMALELCANRQDVVPDLEELIEQGEQFLLFLANLPRQFPS